MSNNTTPHIKITINNTTHKRNNRKQIRNNSNKSGNRKEKNTLNNTN